MGLAKSCNQSRKSRTLYGYVLRFWWSVSLIGLQALRCGLLDFWISAIESGDCEKGGICWLDVFQLLMRETL
jgi:hypothetical protein